MTDRRQLPLPSLTKRATGLHGRMTVGMITIEGFANMQDEGWQLLSGVQEACWNCTR